MSKKQRHKSVAPGADASPVDAVNDGKLAALFAEPERYSIVEMLQIVSGRLRPELTSVELKSIGQEAALLAHYDSNTLAALVATMQHEFMRVLWTVPKILQFAVDSEEANSNWIALLQQSLLEYPSLHARINADKKLAKDPKQDAMKSIRAEWDSWESGSASYENVARFATKMHDKHAAVIENEGSIRNAVTRWRKK